MSAAAKWEKAGISADKAGHEVAGLPPLCGAKRSWGATLPPRATPRLGATQVLFGGHSANFDVNLGHLCGDKPANYDYYAKLGHY